ncbi:helix-turn-helix domain-containing protein [Acetatifactor aquisgranensis]|uniref:helix-turn-helix domain-containing protein n=1 Tax=Acetatifactor aquisgranensis TaxID=2941233 RepID=UPI00203F3456|nr:helix-turn-helix transcriptional regulator [Acetatifactor aquisgranensis]
MEVGAQIRKYRSNMGISQEQLAEKVYVSRQTVSNWETNKNYPDIHSLLLLSTLFDISLDQLIKGDVERMRKEIKETEIRRLNRYGNIYAALLASTVLSAVPLVAWMGWYALIPWAALAGVTMYFAVKVEKVKKDNDIHTYKEIVAFTEGRRLDEMETWQELGKRHYQTVLYALGSAAIGFIVSFFLAKLFLA